MCSDLISPPGTAVRSSRVDSTPSRARRWASVDPVRPAPTISTRAIRQLSIARCRSATTPASERPLVGERAPELERDVLERFEHSPERPVAIPRARCRREALGGGADPPPDEAGAAPGGERARVLAGEPGGPGAVQGLLRNEG